MDTPKTNIFTLRMPPELREELEMLAAEHTRSLAGEIINACRDYVKRESKKAAQRVNA